MQEPVMGPQLVVLFESSASLGCLDQLSKALKTKSVDKQDMFKYRRDSCGNADSFVFKLPKPQGAAIARERLWRRTSAPGRPQVSLIAFQQARAALLLPGRRL